MSRIPATDHTTDAGDCEGWKIRVMLLSGRPWPWVDSDLLLFACGLDEASGTPADQCLLFC